MDEKSFGKLVKKYRGQRGWTQEELAERWGFTRAYVSQIERGRRKLDKQGQVFRLADILGIPDDKLEAVGKGIPKKVEHPLEGSDGLLQALLEPAQNTVKMSWLLWYGNGEAVDVESNLENLARQLNDVLGLYRGQFVKPALRLQAYTHETLGKLAIDRVKTQEAMGHFQAMYDIAEELDDPDIVALSLIHQAETLRRNNRFEASFRRMESAERYIQKHVDEVSPHIQGMLWKAYAINYFVFNNESNFLRAINRAQQIAEDTATTVDTLSGEVDKVEVLQLKAHGYTMLSQPEKALEIYKQTDTLRPFRPMRDQGSYHILKAQAYCHAGDTKTGIQHAVKGMTIAESLRSARYVTRLRQMSDRLHVTPIGQEGTMKELRGEIYNTLARMSQ
jgi:transcriptional regulator with XRE-family HTH domain